MTSLEKLHKQMTNNGLDRVSFQIEMHKKKVSVIFLTDTIPYYLHIAALGLPGLSVEFDVSSDFVVSVAFIDQIGKWAQYFNLKWDDNYHYNPKAFFDVFETAVASIKSFSQPRYSTVLKNTPITEDADKIYFIGTQQNSNNDYDKYGSKICHVTDGNYQKTKLAFGSAVADHYRNANISTKWSSSFSDENLSKFHSDFPDILV